jgi:NAD(P)-dependent dehydrogenase (short-subunit alcohol dehydrogenase family)
MNAQQTSKIALIAGGTGGLGRAVTLTFLEENWKVSVTYQIPEEWSALQSAAGANKLHLEGFHVDVTDEGAVRDLIAGLMKRHTRLDALVNTVGGYAGGIKLWDLDAKVLDKMLALNFRSGFVLARVAVPVMLKQASGAIVNVAAKAAFDHAAGAATYAASKAAAVAMMDSLAADLKGTGVRVNSVLPSIIDTEANRKAMPGSDFGKWPSLKISHGSFFFCAVTTQRLSTVLLFRFTATAESYSGMMTVFSLGRESSVALSRFKCAATNSGGVCVSHSDNERS